MSLDFKKVYLVEQQLISSKIYPESIFSVVTEEKLIFPRA